ncbi:hypothetical protein EHE65_04155 [Salmonella enterica subsp. enterica]|nr:hypothetical protein [Salmonella enterica subsp. enterica]
MNVFPHHWHSSSALFIKLEKTMPACCIRRTSVAVLLLISGAVHADNVAPLPSFFGDMVADSNGHITFEPGLSSCEVGDQCADIYNVTDAANLAVDLARQYTDTRINDVKEYVENYIDNSTSGVDQSYVDNADSKILNDAKTYTDTSSTADRAYTDNQSAQVEQRSQAYTDTVSASDRAYTDNKASQTEQNARDYTDTRSAADRTYTDNKTSQTERNAQEYTDTVSAADRAWASTEAATAEKNANTYTDSKIQKSEASTRTYIDESSENTYNRSVNYTDSRISEGNEYATSYTDNSSKKTLNQANSYTDNRFSQSINYTDNKINEVNSRVSHLSKKMDDNDRRAKAGIAGAMAMSAIPQRFDYDFNFGMGASTYGGEQALSAGSFYNVTSNTTLSAKVALDTQHNVGAAVGFTVGW